MSEDSTKRVLYDSVTFTKGLGDSGRRISIVEKECERCGYDRMILRKDIYPESPQVKSYKCQNPACPDSHNGVLGIPR